MSIPRLFSVFTALLLFSFPAIAKVHSVAIGKWRTVPYSQPSASAQAEPPPASTIRIRPLIVDGKVCDWTTGELHEITDRTFVMRRVVKLNDALPGESGSHWLWVLGPWLLVDRTSAHISVVRLQDFDPAVSDVVWFRDYAAYCGVSKTGKHLLAVVTQLGVARPLIAKPVAKWTVDDHPTPACDAATWQRRPLQVVFHPSNSTAIAYRIFGMASALVEDGESPDEP